MSTRKNKMHSHNHRFQTTKKEFIPLDPEKYGEDIYKMIEYAILLCVCKDVVKVEVKKGNPDEY